MTSQHLDPATLITALYCLVDDLYREQFASRKPSRPGRRPQLSDSEVLTLMLLGQWRADRSERAFLSYAEVYLRSFFPKLLSQSAFNRRARDLMGVVCAMGPAISQQAIRLLGLPQAAYEVLDGVPVPLMRRCRGERHRLFRDEAGIGRGGSDREWFYGIKMLGVVDAHGFFTGFVAGPANTEERWLAEALLRWRQDPTAPEPTAAQLATVLGPTHRKGGRRQGPTGPLGPRTGVGRPSPTPAIADLGYTGRDQHWRSNYHAEVLTQDAYRSLDEDARPQAVRWLNGLRQRVETAFARLDASFGLKFPRARTLLGLRARLGAKVAAFNFATYFNHLLGRPPFSACRPLG